MFRTAPRCAKALTAIFHALALALCLGAPTAVAEDLILVRVNTFPSANNLPLHAGVANGIFAKHGIKLELQFTQNSTDQRNGLATGTFDVAHSASDNGVAMVEVAHQDIIIVAGSDSGMNEFFVRPEIKSFADIRGHTLVVDATNTAFALTGKKILLKNGLKEGDYKLNPAGNSAARFKAMSDDKENVAAVLGLPVSLQAEKAGMKSLGSVVGMLGPYQANSVFVMRAWAETNAGLLTRYLAAYVESVRWVLDPAHRADCLTLMSEKMKLSPPDAERTYQLLTDPSFGLTPDAKIDAEGFRNVLALRAEVEGGKPAAPERYVDLKYYDAALKLLDR
jgi:ABC-type nitrate/sulfonate/bicarbonate transport system substrate-binding protein